MTAGDRAAPASDGKSPAKPRKRRARKKRPARGIGARIGRIAYWGLVVGLWLVIGCVGVIAWVGAHLPPIQSLEIPKRPPSIQIVDMQGRALARRGDLAGAPLPLKEMPSLRAEGLHRHRGPALLRTLRRRPVRHRARLRRQRPASRRRARRLDHHAAARQESLSDARAHDQPQAAGSAAGAVAGAQVLQDADPRDCISTASISASGAYGIEQASQRYFGKSARTHHARRGGDAGRPREVAVATCADAQFRRRRAARANRARGHGRSELHQRTPPNACALARPPRIVAQASNGAVNYVADWIMDALNDTIGHVDEDIVVQTTIDANLQAVRRESARPTSLRRRATRTASAKARWSR